MELRKRDYVLEYFLWTSSIVGVYNFKIIEIMTFRRLVSSVK